MPLGKINNKNCSIHKCEIMGIDWRKDVERTVLSGTVKRKRYELVLSHSGKILV